MKRSSDRILTTHAGSLIRPAQLRTFLDAKRKGEAIDETAYEECLKTSVAEIVIEQEKVGLDVISDGEFGKAISWSQYMLERISGFERRPVTLEQNPFNRGADRARFREFYAELDAENASPIGMESVCIGPVAYTGQAALQRDIDNFKAALADVHVTEGFLPVAAPSSVIPDRKNEYYKTDEDLLQAIAQAMATEYRQIVDQGLLVQLDDARAAVTYDRTVPPRSMADFLGWLEHQVDTINTSLDGIPEDRVRYHVCWGSWPGPHTSDVPLKDIVDIVLRVKAGAYVIEGANPRHEQEWKVWQSVKLPPGRMIIPGVVSHATNVVEHPELVADRIIRYANVVGRENVIAGTDCGFAQTPLLRRVHPSVMWAKLEALTEGARLASQELWDKAAA